MGVVAVAAGERFGIPIEGTASFYRPWLQDWAPALAANVGADIPINAAGLSSGVHHYFRSFDAGPFVGVQAYVDRFTVSSWESGGSVGPRWWTLAAAPKVGWKWVDDAGWTVAIDAGAGGRLALGDAPDELADAAATQTPFMVTTGVWLGGTF